MMGFPLPPEGIETRELQLGAQVAPRLGLRHAAAQGRLCADAKAGASRHGSTGYGARGEDEDILGGKGVYLGLGFFQQVVAEESGTAQVAPVEELILLFGPHATIG